MQEEEEKKTTNSIDDVDDDVISNSFSLLYSRSFYTDSRSHRTFACVQKYSKQTNT